MVGGAEQWWQQNDRSDANTIYKQLNTTQEEKGGGKHRPYNPHRWEGKQEAVGHSCYNFLR